MDMQPRHFGRPRSAAEHHSTDPEAITHRDRASLVQVIAVVSLGAGVPAGASAAARLHLALSDQAAHSGTDRCAIRVGEAPAPLLKSSATGWRR